jgi:hypothetical protein
MEHGFNVAWPIVPDGTDLIAYDKGKTWQIQVKCLTGEHQRIDTRGRFAKQKVSSKEDYKYIDIFMAINLVNEKIHVLPTWIQLPEQFSVKFLLETSADLIRLPQLPCLLGAHSCDKTCNKCRPHLQAMSATDREGLLALISRSHRATKRSKQKGRRGQ